MKPRIFTVPEANRQIPRVQSILSRLEEWHPRLLESQERLKEMEEKGLTDPPERVRLSHELERAEHEVSGVLQEIEEIGCRLKDGGLVDFYTVKDGILYELCWHSGEKEIRFYHECETGFNGRQPLTPEDIAGMGVGFAADAETPAKRPGQIRGPWSR
ncbi:MAG: DUF2203 family protein [Candidatus Latescibacteria bacterium]|nr:DUF2203 family protein [Candidatus Latescibacterota bacterium]